MPKVVKQLRIAKGDTSTIWDYRGETSPNGGRINLRACVWHIPVMPNLDGRGDLDALRRVLQAQGLMVQFGNDAEGNIALYTRADRLCWHARGANSVTCGVEQMHMTIGEDWTLKQLRSAAWIAQYLEREFDIPLQMADVDRGPGNTATIVRKGHTSHRQISRMAGFNDRSDPGPGFDYEYVFSAAKFFKRHGHFVGA
jgi:N-acetylmuramoyl-L-alanine amidase-like protein